MTKINNLVIMYAKKVSFQFTLKNTDIVILKSLGMGVFMKTICEKGVMVQWNHCSTVYNSEGGQMISAINSQVIRKLHLGSERAELREALDKEKQSLRFQVRNPLVPQTSC